MLKVKSMSKLRIAGPKSEMRNVINRLHELRLLHLVEYRGKDFFTIGSPFEESNSISAQLVQVSSLVSSAGIKGKGIRISLDGAQRKFLEIEKEFVLRSGNVSLLKEKINSINSQLESLKPISTLNMPLSTLSGYSKIAVFKGIFRPRPTFEKELSQICADYELKLSHYRNRTVIALFVPVQSREKAQTLLSDNGYSELNFDASQNTASLERELSELKAKLASEQAKLTEVISRNSQFLLDYEYSLDVENEKYGAPLKFATSANAFIISGWIPTNDAKKIESELSKASNDRIHVEVLKVAVPSDHDSANAPIAFSNPALVKDFQFFLDLYNLPKYIELDPTFFMFLIFPMFYGFILGDVGYGITCLIAFFIIKTFMTKSPGNKTLLNVLMLSSACSIIFGFVFGEFFGMEFLEHPLINRAHDLNFMLIMTILIGAIHVTFGLMMGFYNKLMQHGFKHALLEKGSWLLLELGAVFMVLAFLGIAPFNSMIIEGLALGMLLGAAILVLSIIMLYLGEGVRGMIELPALLSNILSYARLFAVGLASVQLALIINGFAEDFIAQGGVMIVAAIVILILGHGVNITLGILGSFLHSLRLHYVEFFGKFFEGGGPRYSPFGLREN